MARRIRLFRSKIYMFWGTCFCAIFLIWVIRSQIYFDVNEKSLYRKIKLVENSWFEKKYVGSWIQNRLLSLKWENYVKLYCTSNRKNLALAKEFTVNNYKHFSTIIGKRIGFQNGHSIFDNGCGCGAFLSAFNQSYRNVKVGGLDLSTGAIEHAKKIFPKQTHNFQVGTVEDLSFVNNATYDHAMTFCTFPYVTPENQCRAVKEMLRIIKPGGSLYIGHNLETECAKKHVGIYSLPLCFWNEHCLNGHEDVEEIYYAKERELFGLVKYCPEKTAVFVYKKGGKTQPVKDTMGYSCDSKFEPSGRRVDLI